VEAKQGDDDVVDNGKKPSPSMSAMHMSGRAEHVLKK
jgi:hypothetical protein